MIFMYFMRIHGSETPENLNSKPSKQENVQEDFVVATPSGGWKYKRWMKGGFSPSWKRLTFGCFNISSKCFEFSP